MAILEQLPDSAHAATSISQGARASVNQGMGKLLFVNTSRTNGIVGLVICACVIVAGLWFGVSGAYAGLLLAPLGLVGGKFCLKIATLKSHLYENGFICKSIFGSVSAKYADLKSITRGAVRVNGVLNTNVHFSTQSGETATISKEALGSDDKMNQLVNHACGALAMSWMRTLEKRGEVVWMTNGSLPILKIRKDGVLVEGKNGVDGFIPLSQLQMKPGHAMLVNVCNGDQKVISVNSGQANFFVGEALIAMLLASQGQSPIANS